MRLVILLIVMIPFCVSAALGQSETEEPERELDLKEATCIVYNEVVEAEDGRSDVLYVWAHGYWTGQQGVTEENVKEPLSWSRLEVFVQKLNSACAKTPGKLWVAAIREVK
jgi:hypothetical protein